MKQTRVARLFKDGPSQAVRLPAEFRLDGDEVYATRDDATGDVVLSNRLGMDVWNEFFASLHAFDAFPTLDLESSLEPMRLEPATDL